MKKIVFSKIFEPNKTTDKKEIYSYIEEFIKTNSDKYSWKVGENKCECIITPKNIWLQPSILDYCGEIDAQTLKSKHKIIITMDVKLNQWFWIDLVILVIVSIFIPDILILLILVSIYFLYRRLTYRYYFFNGLESYLNERFEGWE